MNWTEDQKTEARLQSLNIKYDIAWDIQLKDLRVEESRNNNARFGSTINEDHVLKMAQSMISGSPFPYITITGVQVGKYSPSFILAGNNRIAAASIAGVTNIRAYRVTQADELSLDEFVRLDNVDHGLLLTNEDKVQQAVHFIRNHGWTYTEALIKFFGDNKKYLQIIKDACVARDVEQALYQMGFNDASKLDKQTLAILNKLIDDKPNLKYAAELVLNHKPNVSDTTAYINAVADIPDISDRKEMLARWKVNKVKSNIEPTPAIKLIATTIAKLNELITSSRLLKQSLNPKQLKDLKANIEALNVNLKVLKSAIK